MASALRETETETSDASAAGRPSRTWRWIAAAAALVIVAVGTLAVVSANGGHDEQQQASGDRSIAVAPKAVSAAPNTSRTSATCDDIAVQPAPLRRRAEGRLVRDVFARARSR